MRRAEPVAGAGGLLLLVSLFLPWYALDTSFAMDGATLVQQHVLITGVRRSSAAGRSCR